MREDTSTSPTTPAGEALDAKVTAAVDRYGHLREFQPLLELMLEIYEELERAKGSGQ
jgi:hypothetical protein